MPETSTPEPWTVSVKDAAARTGLTKWGIYKLADAGVLDTVYSGSRRLVIYSSLRDYIESLPTERPEVSA
jgi:excisionase family DNA binding protein